MERKGVLCTLSSKPARKSRRDEKIHKKKNSNTVFLSWDLRIDGGLNMFLNEEQTDLIKSSNQIL